MLYYLYTLEYSDRETAVKEDTATTVELAPLPVPPQPRPVTSNGEEDAQQAAVPESSTGPSEEPAKQAAAETKMMNNTLVYRIAEKYGIPELKVMAREKFEKLAWSQWPHEGFATIIEVVYSTTPETDHGLRDIITSICAEHIQEILLLPDVSVVISEHGQLGLGITREVVRESCRDKEKLRESVAVEQALADDLAQSKKEVIDRNERLTAILVNARNISFCRHCYRPFTSRIERGDGFGLLPMRVSCIECGTRHDI